MRRPHPFYLFVLFLLLSAITSGEFYSLAEASPSPPIPAEILEKAFLRADHNHKSKSLGSCSEGAGVDILAEWNSPDGIRWYQVKSAGIKGWIMAKFVRVLIDDLEKTDIPSQSPLPVQSPSSQKQPPQQKSDYISVKSAGSGTTRAEAIERAWMEAVRLAVGVVISSKTEVSNDEISERIIAHSRGIVESYRIIDEKQESNRVNVTIEANVQRQLLVDATKTYGETYVVDASTKKAVNARDNAVAKAKTEEETKKTGMELLKEVMASYSPDMFLTARLNPEIFYDSKNKRYAVEIAEIFNENLFWKEFLPRVREALEGVAASKKKKTYFPKVRTANQELSTKKFIIDRPSGLGYANYSHQIEGIAEDPGKYSRYPFAHEIYWHHGDMEDYAIVVPDNNSTYSVYYFNFGIPLKNFTYTAIYKRREKIDRRETVDESIAPLVDLMLDWWWRMDAPLTYMVTFFDENGDIIHTQPFETGFRAITIYRSLGDPIYFENSLLERFFTLAPGFTPPMPKWTSDYNNHLFLDTTKIHFRWLLDEYMNDKIDRVKRMKLEAVFER